MNAINSVIFYNENEFLLLIFLIDLKPGHILECFFRNKKDTGAIPSLMFDAIV